MYDAKCDELEMCQAAMAGMMKVKPREVGFPALEQRCDEAECSLKEKCQEVDHFKRQLAYADSKNE